MPLYHVPNARTVGLYVWNNTLSFVRRAGSLILIASVAVWALSSFPGGGIDRSVLSYLGRGLEPLGRLMGLGDWRMIVALLTSFFAKENVIATPVSYTHLRAHETRHDLVCRLLLEKKK